MDLTFTTRPGRGCLIVHLDGVLDLGTVPQVREHLQQVLDGGALSVVLDLAAVRLIDSTALGMMVWLRKELLERDGRVYVAGARPVVLSVLRLTSVDCLVQLSDDVEAAEADITA